MALQFIHYDNLATNLADLPSDGSSFSSLTTMADTRNTSRDLTGVELRMLPPLIKDNRTPKVFPFPGYARLYCLTIVVSDVANQLAGMIDLNGFPRIGDQEALPVNKTLFYWQQNDASPKQPDQIHLFCSVIKCKESLRKVGQVMSKVQSDAQYKDLVSQLGALAGNAANFNAVSGIILQVAGIVGRYLGEVDDKPLGTIINSYTSVNGDFDRPGITKTVYPTRDVDFTIQMGIRQQRQAITDLVDSRNGSAAATESEEVEVDGYPL